MRVKLSIVRACGQGGRLRSALALLGACAMLASTTGSAAPVSGASPSAPPSATAPTPDAATTPTNAPTAAAGSPPAAPQGSPGTQSAGSASPASPTGPSAADTRALDEETQALKKDVVDLNRDLYVLEEELLYPANTQVAVFVSMDVGSFFALDSVRLEIDRKEVANYLYTPREVQALLEGGVQRIYVGNLKVGPHELVAFFTGKGPNDRDYKRGASVRFDKSIGAHYLELKINDRQHRLQPEFEIKDWGE